jgi:hypothetical protein
MQLNSTTIPATGKHIEYDRETCEYAAYYDGNLVGFFGTPWQAESALDDIAYDVLTHPQASADAVAQYREELATSADIDAYVAQWNADVEYEHELVLDYADAWNADARQRVASAVVLLPADVVCSEV